MPRVYRHFPNVEVLKALLSGKGYIAVAKHFGYYDADQPDPLKRFRAILRQKRVNGFAHIGTVEYFPKFDRRGIALLNKGQQSPFIDSLMGSAPIKFKPIDKHHGIAQPAKVTLVDEKPRGRRPRNTVLLVLDMSRTLITIDAIDGNTKVPVKALIEALAPLMSE